ncbi:MAG: hydrogenase maturation nickel metallochaperone HypA [Clostridiales bacterium]|nr:hydrogenase maturation nickel metallochaperone HypA [Clostridiales bacterium]
MHELSITQSILNIALSSAENAGAKKINSIKITLGEMTGCVPQYIQEYFDIVSDGTIAAHAKLEFKTVPAVAQCADCGKETRLIRFRFRCEHCGSQKLTIVSGKEFLVDSIDIED